MTNGCLAARDEVINFAAQNLTIHINVNNV